MEPLIVVLCAVNFLSDFKYASLSSAIETLCHGNFFVGHFFILSLVANFQTNRYFRKAIKIIIPKNKVVNAKTVMA